ncbi:MAG: M23 family peptidase, partial [Sheuella sp.]|nr:M23 family peptidase [Sheuella sp.]
MLQENNLASGEATSSLSPMISEARSNRQGILRGALIASTLALCVGAAALGMVQPSGENLIPPEQKLVQHIVPITLSAESSAPDLAQQQTETPYVHETRIRAGDSLATVLKRLDIADGELLTFLTRDPNARAVYKLYPGRSVQSATNEQGQLLWIRYFHSPNVESNGKSVARLLQISTTENGFKAQEIEQLTEIHTEVAIGTIERSLFATTDAAGIPDGITSQMAEVLGSKVDFLRGLKRGDQFRVVYEARTNEGRNVGSGRVLALEFVNNGRAYSAIWYSPDGKSGSYYDANGDSLQGAFLRNAIKFSRISSTFGMRTMAGHQAWSGHHPGVDYAAPT